MCYQKQVHRHPCRPVWTWSHIAAYQHLLPPMGFLEEPGEGNSVISVFNLNNRTLTETAVQTNIFKALAKWSRKFLGTCDSIWPLLACTWGNLQWLTFTLNKLKFASKLGHVFHCLATKCKLMCLSLSIVFTRSRVHTRLHWNGFSAIWIQLASTCGSI